MASKLYLGETHSELVRKFNELVDEFKSYLPLSGGTLTGNVLLSNSNAQGSQPNLKWKTINSKTPYVGYCTGSTDGTFMIASIGGTTYTTGLSIGGTSGNLLWKGTKVATTSDIPTALKNPNALKFGSKTYDGSSAQTITASDIGANVTVTQKLTSGSEIGSITVGSTTTKLYAPTSTGSGIYLPLSGGTLTGNLTIQQGQSINVSQYNDAGGVSLMNNGGGTATQFGSSARPARMFSSVQPEWYKNGASQGVLAIKTDIPTTLSQLTNDADYTTKSYVDSKIANLLNSAPETLDTLGELATAIQAHEDEYDALLQTVGSKVKKTTQTATVLGTSKTTEAIGEYQLVFPKGAVFSGTAASAGLVTRGICGVTTPDANGSCSKDNLYINYDGDNEYRSPRQLVLQAGQVGTHYGNNLYQYCAARGDAVKGYVDANTIKSLSVSGATITYTKGDGSTGKITTQDQYVKQTHVSDRMLCSLALLPNNTSSEVTAQVYKNTSLYANPDRGTLYATSFYENGTALSDKYHPKKRKVTLAELQAAMSTMTTGTRIQVVSHGFDDDLLYSVGACITYSSTYGSAYNSQTRIDYDANAGMIYYVNWGINITSTVAQAINITIVADGSSIYVDEVLTENLSDSDTDFYILD